MARASILTGNTNRQETIEMVKAYQKGHKKEIEKGGKKAASAGWFALDPLIAFLQALKTQRGADGVRVYFGVSVKEDPRKGFNTIVLVGTKNDGDQEVDLPESKEKELVVQYAYTVGNDDFDNSHLCPPNCDYGETVLQEALKP